MAPQLAWIGLGNIGRGMCKNLVEKGNLDKPLIIYNRTRQRAEDLAAKLGGDGKTKVVGSIEEAVKDSDIIFTCVGDDNAMKETMETMLKTSGGVQRKLFVDCSTVHPSTTAGLYKTVTDAGARFVAAPVFGAPPMAESGQLVIVLAGPAADVERVKPFAKGVMGRDIIDYSDQEPGQALLLKIIGNTMILNMCEGLAEGHTLAEKTGLGSENLHAFINAMLPGPYVAYSNRMKAFDFAQPDFQPFFHADLAAKDARHAADLAASSGTKMRALEVVTGHLKDVKSLAGDKGDIAGIYGAVRNESGLPYGPK